jgi:hypothetical protein
MSLIWRHGAVLMGALPLWGCAQNDPTVPTAELGVRIIVTTRDDYPSAGDVMARAASLARVPVRDVQGLATQRYRMTVVCADETACRAAVQRIAADRSFALGVEGEERQKIPTKPTRDASR